MTGRRSFLKSSVAALAAAGFSPLIARSAEIKSHGALRIGFQKSSSILIFLKARNTLEEKLAPLGVEVKWTEFTSGLPLLEGLNVGSIDLTADVAETVPLFAQAAGANLTYVVDEAPSPTAQAIVVKSNSPIRSVSDLKGRKIALTKAAGVHYLLLEALTRAGLQFKDIEPAYLTPADGRAAFERDSVDAWVIWDPFLAAVQRQAEVRILLDGKGIASYRRFYLASSTYAKQRSDVINVVVAELTRVGAWIKQNPKEAAQFHAPLIGVDAPTAELANSRRSYDVRAVDADALAEQQRIADAFTGAGLLPKKIVLAEVQVWRTR